MKKCTILFAALGAMAFISCEDNKEPEVALIKSMEIEATTNSVFADSEELPTLTLKAEPSDIAKSIEWSSSNEALVTVDEDGALTLVKFEYNKSVTISAIDKDSKVKADCKIDFKVKKADIDDYGIITTKGYKFNNPYNSEEQFEITFDILDRNLGATALDKIGDYYQFGNDIAVATSTECGDSFDKEYNEPILDWSKAENTPCPEGWRMLTAAEASVLADAMHIADSYYGGDQSDADQDAAYAFEDKLHIPYSGYYWIDGETADDRAANTPTLKLSEDMKAFWSGAIEVDDNSENILTKRGFIQARSFEYNNMSLSAKAEINTARPIRCVK